MRRQVPLAGPLDAKRMRTWSEMRDFVALTVTGPFSRAAAT